MESLRIKQKAGELGADLCGIASIDRFEDSPDGFHPYDVFPETRSIIAFACRTPKTLHYVESNMPYTSIANIVQEEIKHIGFKLNIHLEDMGHRAILVPSVPYDYWDEKTKTGKGLLSLKHCAEKAGLGFIGKNSLLTSPVYGSFISVGVILSNKTLQPDNIIGATCSEDCNLCIKSCPVGAIDDSRHVNQKKCREYSEVLNKRGVEIYACYECKRACPHNTKLSVL